MLIDQLMESMSVVFEVTLHCHQLNVAVPYALINVSQLLLLYIVSG